MAGRGLGEPCPAGKRGGLGTIAPDHSPGTTSHPAADSSSWAGKSGVGTRTSRHLVGVPAMRPPPHPHVTASGSQPGPWCHSHMGVSTLGLGMHSSAATAGSPPLTPSHGGSDQLRLAHPRGRMRPTRRPLRRLPCLRPERPPSAAALPATPFLCSKQEACFQQKMFLLKEPARVPGEAQPGRAPRRLGQAGPRRGPVTRQAAGTCRVAPGSSQCPAPTDLSEPPSLKLAQGRRGTCQTPPLHPEKGSPPLPLSSRRQRSC